MAEQLTRLGLGNCQCEHENHRSIDEPGLQKPTKSHTDHFYGHGCATKIVLTTWGTYEMCEGCAQDVAKTEYFVKFLANHSEAATPVDECLHCEAKLMTLEEKVNHFVGGICIHRLSRPETN